MESQEKQASSPQDQLLEALEAQDLDAFRTLLRSGRLNPRHRYRDQHFGTCLEIAARRPFGAPFVRVLLEHVKPSVNRIVPEPLHHAAKRGHADVLDTLLADRRTRAGAADSEGRTALHYACVFVAPADVAGYERCVRLLMGRFSPADVNRADAHGFSAIHAAAKSKPKAPSTREGVADGAGEAPSEEQTWRARKRLVLLMLDLGRDVLDLDSTLANGRSAREDLLQRFPELERELPVGPDAAHADPHSALTRALSDGRADLFRALLSETDSAGDPVLDPDHWFGAPLHATCLELACRKRGAHAFVKALLAAGADPNAANKLDKKFPVHVACKKGHHKQLVALFEGSQATDPNARDSLGNTALHYVVEKWTNDARITTDKRSCLDTLLRRQDVDVNRKNNKGLTALMLAVQSKNKYAVKSILVTKRDSLDLSVEFEGKELRIVIVEVYPDMSNLVSNTDASSTDDNEIDWFDLLRTRENEFVERLRIQPMEKLSLNDKKFTLLQRAANYGMDKAVKALLEKGADVNETFKGNLSPPGVIAAYNRHKKVIDMFLKHPSFDVNAVDGKGNSALHYAARYEGDLDIVVQLLRRGADMKIVNSLGKTAMGIDHVQSLLDQCILTNGKHSLDEEYTLILDYCLLAPGTEDRDELASASVQYQSVPSDENAIEVVGASGNDDLESEMLFLHMMSKDNEIRSLLDHPIARSFLELKWSRVKPLAYFNFGVYVAFVVFLNMFIINSKSLIVSRTNIANMTDVTGIPDITNITNTTDIAGITDTANITNMRQDVLNTTDVDDKINSSPLISLSLVLAWFSLGVSLLFWAMLCLREAIQFTFDQRKYIGSVENYLDWSILLFSIVALFMPVIQPENSLLNVINVVTIMLSCAELLMLLGRLSHFAKYVEMLKVVLHSYFLPLLSYCIIIIAFGLSFHTLLRESKGIERNTTLNENMGTDLNNSIKNFDTWYMSIIKSLVMMTGELDFDSFPDRSIVSLLLFVMFVLLVTVVLLNLLIGLAVNDTQKIEVSAQQLRLKTRVELVLFTESILVNMHNSKWRILRKLSTLLLRQKLQGALLFPRATVDNRRALVKPNQNAELVFAEEDGTETRLPVPRELLEHATKIISRRSNEEAAEAKDVTLAAVDAKLQRVLQLLAGRGAAVERTSSSSSSNVSCGGDGSGGGSDGGSDGGGCMPDERLGSVFQSEDDDG